MESARRRYYLETTHEPDEIETQIKLYIPAIHLQVKAEINVFNMNEKISQKYLSGDFSDLLNAIKYVEKYEPKFNPFPMLATAFVDYNIPSNVEELLLKAEIADDKKMVKFLAEIYDGLIKTSRHRSKVSSFHPCGASLLFS